MTTVTDKELRARRGASGTVAESSVDLEAAAKQAMEEFVDTLTRHTNRFVSEVNKFIKRGKEDGEAKLADITTFPAGLPPYPWWNLVMAGPYQPLGAGTTGPFAANKIIRAGEPAFILGAIWRNPAPINWAPPGPSPVQMMAALQMSVQFQTLNLTTGVAGPTFVPAGIPSPLGFAQIIPFFASLAFPAPAQGAPHLYEINLVADVSGPVPGLPFAGYSTWSVNPDLEPPFLFLPAIAPALQRDIPARIMVYTA